MEKLGEPYCYQLPQLYSVKASLLEFLNEHQEAAQTFFRASEIYEKNGETRLAQDLMQHGMKVSQYQPVETTQKPVQ